jgi:hypothetical protein
VWAGGVERECEGGHRLVKMTNGKNLSIPSGILKVGLLKSLVKSADLTEDEFRSYL